MKTTKRKLAKPKVKLNLENDNFTDPEVGFIDADFDDSFGRAYIDDLISHDYDTRQSGDNSWYR